MHTNLKKALTEKPKIIYLTDNFKYINLAEWRAEWMVRRHKFGFPGRAAKISQ
jgi:hypothetical protein